MMQIMVFVACFFQVFALGCSSKFLRDDKIVAGFMISWVITVSQYGFTWAVTHAGLTTPTFLLCAGLGGSIGITTAQYFYKWYDRKFHEQD
jgi:hypothetical protein